MAGVYEALGVVPVINGVGAATRLGGLPVSDRVWAAMQESAKTSVRVDELQAAAGRRIAELLGVPSAYVTCGASAALALATAVCIAGGDPATIGGLPDPEGRANEVLVQMGHLDPYDHALTGVGATLRTVGYPMSCRAFELEAAISAKTAAVLYRPGAPGDLLSLGEVVAMAHAHSLPVIVDGALTVPPLQNLSSIMAVGADLVAISGGKGFRGPQTSGILCGRADLIACAGLHHQDMDERPRTWPMKERWRSEPPRHGICRAMKVGREQITGLVAAVTEHTEEGAQPRHTPELDAIVDRLGNLEAIRTDRSVDIAGEPLLSIDVSTVAADLDVLIWELGRGSPRVFVREDDAWRGILKVSDVALLPGDGARIAEAILAALDAVSPIGGDKQDHA